MTMSETARFQELAREWLARGNLSAVGKGDQESVRLLDISVQLSVATNRLDASPETLAWCEKRFDEIMSVTPRSDFFGERIELGLLLAFVGWSQSSRLELEESAEQWLRVAISLVGEPSTCAEVIDSLVRLPSGKITFSLLQRFVGKASDLFLTIALLRRNSNRMPRECREVAIAIHDWLLAAGSGRYGPESGRLLVEIAFVVAGMSRAMGLNSETVAWLRRARTYLKGIRAARIATARLDVVRALYLFDQKRFDEYRDLVSELSPTLRLCGLYREDLQLRIGLALSQVVSGDLKGGWPALERLVEETAQGDLTLHSCCLAHLAQIQAVQGDGASAIKNVGRALTIAAESQEPQIVSMALGLFAAIQSSRGKSSGAREAVEAAIQVAEQSGFLSFAAYLRVYLAELSIAAEDYPAAFSHLLQAVPVIGAERLVAEGIHAMKLLKELVNLWTDGADRVRGLVRTITDVGRL